MRVEWFPIECNLYGKVPHVRERRQPNWHLPSWRGGIGSMLLETQSLNGSKGKRGMQREACGQIRSQFCLKLIIGKNEEASLTKGCLRGSTPFKSVAYDVN